MKKLYEYQSDKKRAATADPTGSNLPASYGPWRFRRELHTPEKRIGLDKATMAIIAEQGFVIVSR